MRLLPSGSAALLLELGDLDEVLALYAALVDDPVEGVVDVVPAARTVLVVTDPRLTSLALPFQDMGTLAVERLLAPDRPDATVTRLPLVLEAGGSVAGDAS